MALTNPRFSSDPALAAAAKNSPPIKRGAKSEGVQILQQALLDLGVRMPRSTRARHGLPDGIFGEETEQAVRAFQRAHGLQTDGAVGPKTLQALERSIKVLSELEDARFRAEFLRLGAAGGQVG